MNKITFCIPCKNNLRYIKHAIRSIRETSCVKHDIIVFLDDDSDHASDWLTRNDVKYLKNPNSEPMGIAYGYNRCIENAKTDIICAFHADMIMGENFESNTLKHLIPNSVVSGTRIEPPLHPPGKEKIVMDFGMYPEDFKEDEFDAFVNSASITYKDQTTRGIFAPWMCFKKDIINIGMHDERFHSYHEDTDIFQRFILNNMKIIQSRDAFVYHLTCRGGQFQDGIEKVTTDPKFHSMKDLSFKLFIRKWGNSIRNDEYAYPIVAHKYDIGFVATNSTQHLLAILEPWCSTLYADINSEKTNDILVWFDCNKLTNTNIQFLFNTLPDVIFDTNDVGTFELDIFKIEIRNLRLLNNNLIHVEN